jgi:hypothetical protein
LARLVPQNPSIPRHGRCPNAENIEILERKIQAICTVNDEIIQRIILKTNSGDQMIDYDYVIFSEAHESHQPHRFVVEDIRTTHNVKEVVENWEISSNADLPVNPDPEHRHHGHDLQTIL